MKSNAFAKSANIAACVIILVSYLAGSAELAWASRRLNNDMLSPAAIEPDAWDYFIYASLDSVEALDLADINARLAKVAAKIPENIKQSSPRDLAEHSRLLLQKFTASYHTRIKKFRSDYAKWYRSGASGKKPVFSLGDDKRVLQQALVSFRALVLDFPKEFHSDEIYMNLSQMLALNSKDNSLLYIKKLVKQYPKTSYRKEAQLLMGELYFDGKDYAKAFKNYSALKNSTDNKVRLYALYKIAWLHFIKTPDNIEAVSEKFKEVVRIALNQGESRYGKHLAQEAMGDLVHLWSDEKYVHLAEDFFNQNQQTDFYLWTLEGHARRDLEKKNYKEAIATYLKMIAASPIKPSNLYTHRRIVEVMDALAMYPQVIRTIAKMEKTYLGKSPWTLANKDEAEAAKALIEGLIRKYGSKYQKLPRGESQGADLLSKGVAFLYELYLRDFPDHKFAGNLRLRLAKLQVDTKQHLKAAENYRLLSEKLSEKPQKNPDAQYALSKSALIQYDKALASTDVPKPEAAQPLREPMPLPKLVQLTLNFVETHTKTFNKEEFDISQKLSAANLYYTYGHYPKAIALWQDVITNHGDAPQTQTAIATQAAYYTLATKWQENLDFINKMIQEKKISDGKTATAIVGHMRTATFSLAKQWVAKNSFKEAAGLYLNFQKRFPQVKQADQALFEAFTLMGKYADADTRVATGELFLKTYEESPLSDRVILSLADLYASMVDYERAAQVLYRLPETYPKHPKAAEALMRSSDFFLAMEQRDRAVGQYVAFMKLFPQSPLAGEVLGKLLKVLLSQDNTELARSVSEVFLKAGNAKRRPMDQFYAQAVATVYSQGNTDRLIAALATKPLQLREAASKFLSEHLHEQLLAFVKAEAEYELDPSGDIKALGAERKKKFKVAEALCKKIMALEVHDFQLSANFHTALLYATHARKLTALVGGANEKNKLTLQNLAFAAQEVAERYTEFTQGFLNKGFSLYGKDIYRRLPELKRPAPVHSELTLSPGWTTIILK